jgi:hypothetical protein
MFGLFTPFWSSWIRLLNSHVQVFVVTQISFLLAKDLVVEWLDHMLIAGLTFEEVLNCFL